jgi:hypothetical protein
MAHPGSNAPPTGLGPAIYAVVKILLLTAVAMIVLGADWWIVELRESVRGDDFFQFWAAARAILHGDDPYDPQAWQRIYEGEGRWRWQTDQPVFLYPLWTAFPFVPLAALPVPWAALLWAIISELLLVSSAWLVIRALEWGNCADWLPWLIAIVMPFNPALLTILFGHLGILLLCVLCAVLFLVARGHYAPAGILLAVTLIKPQLMLLVIPVLLLALSWQRRWSFLAWFTISTLGLISVSWLLMPGWPTQWQQNLTRTASVRLTISPTIWGFSHTLASALVRLDLWRVIGAPICLLLMGVVGYLWYTGRNDVQRGRQLATLLSVTVVVSLLLSPYVLSYDFVLLLLPAIVCLWLIQPLPKLFRRSLLASLLGSALLLPWALLGLSARTGQETTSMLFPASLLTILLVGHVGRHRWEKKAATTARRDELPLACKQMEV